MQHNFNILSDVSECWRDSLLQAFFSMYRKRQTYQLILNHKWNNQMLTALTLR